MTVLYVRPRGRFDLSADVLDRAEQTKQAKTSVA